MIINIMHRIVERAPSDPAKLISHERIRGIIINLIHRVAESAQSDPAK